MTETAANSTTTELIEAVARLPDNHQRSVLNFALFLRAQEEERRLAVEDALWDERFGNPERMAKFAAWAEASLAEGLTPLELTKL